MIEPLDGSVLGAMMWMMRRMTMMIMMARERKRHKRVMMSMLLLHLNVKGRERERRKRGGRLPPCLQVSCVCMFVSVCEYLCVFPTMSAGTLCLCVYLCACVIVIVVLF